MTYLLLRLSSIGNVAMTVPIISSVSALHPNDHFVVVAEKDMSAAFYGLENVTFVQTERKQYHLSNILSLYHELQEYAIDAVIDLQNTLHTQLLRGLFRLHKVPIYSIEYGRLEKRILALRGAKHAQPLKTEFARYHDTFVKAGLVSDDTFTAIPVNTKAKDAIHQQYGDKHGIWMGIAPFAKSQSNILPYRVTKEIITRLSSMSNIRIFLFGGGKIESEMLRQWSSLYPNVECVAGQLTLDKELELMRQLDGMVCQDSANQHLCALVGLKTISIWCGTHPDMGFAGWKQDPSSRIQKNNLTCRPCTIHGTNFCKFGNFACKHITAEQIVKHIQSTINLEKNIL